MLDRRAFVVGRLTSKGTLLIFLQPVAGTPRGPWTLAAVVSPN